MNLSFLTDANANCGLHVTAELPLALLDRLALASLPQVIHRAEQIELLRVLQLAGSLRADIPVPKRTLHGFDQAPATVLQITAAGRTLLSCFSKRGRSKPTHGRALRVSKELLARLLARLVTRRSKPQRRGRSLPASSVQSRVKDTLHNPAHKLLAS